MARSTVPAGSSAKAAEFLAATTPGSDTPPSRDGSARLVRDIVAGWRCQALHAAVQLNIPEALSSGPQTAADLACITGAHEDGLARLLRGLCTLRVCSQRGDGRFTLTGTGRRLCARPPDGGPSLRDLVRWWGGPLWSMWGELAYSVRTGASAREKLSGQVGYAAVMGSADIAKTFHGAQQAMTALVQDELACWPGWAAMRHVVDVGGGHGQVALAIARSHPDLHATVFDLPQAEAGAVALCADAGLQARCQFVAGSFLDGELPKADAYLLKSILHNWDDAHCHAILRRCADAAPPHGRLILVERVLPARLTAHARDEAAARTDLNMLAGLGGRERSMHQYAALLRKVGFSVSTHWTLNFEFTVVEASRGARDVGI